MRIYKVTNQYGQVLYTSNEPKDVIEYYVINKKHFKEKRKEILDIEMEN